ncbi:RNA-directed DNA polymerase, eukaryota, reverse transcriptase zinc-binding domain protein [Tanacetum coccineum]|uniref:RNA-directed DNA polymerase, eukaryota, reverse transcriptase zinc-binding domain protein n=1 Tax=Tanacetum coccineum TaxID=301880 RepID=A0ABQ4WC59_9ASTR
MDAMNTMMCNQEAERFGFARVLVEINAAKECRDSIEVQYVDAQRTKLKTKIVQVEYQWKPVRCNHCKVYGHGLIECKKRPRIEEELKQNKGRRKEVIDKKGLRKILNKENVEKMQKEDGKIGQKDNGEKIERREGEVRKNTNGGRGLIQGDPISPYLFTIVMKMLNLILERKINQTKKFTYHPSDKRSFEEFSEISGLYPNLSKRLMFYSNVNEGIKEDILQVVPFTIGKLLVRYLGVPLVTKKLSFTDCKGLIERVKGKITVIKEIDSLLRSFLWSQGEKVQGKAKITWKNICKPKCNGGLGLKLLDIWNKQDKWHERGPIARFISRRQMSNARIDCNIHVAGMIENGQWRWLNEWYDQFQELKEIKTPTIDEHKQDSVMWLSNEQRVVKFSINRVWGDISSQENKVDWHDVVWFPNAIPRHAFILWLLVHERLPTQDRLAKWYPNRVIKCAMCLQEQDSHQHLFFNCPYSKKV